MRQKTGDEESAVFPEADRAALEAFVVENPDLERLEVLLDQFNVFEAMGAVRQELRHSDFLAFLLNPQQPHGLSDTFLRRLLQRTLRSVTSNGTFAISDTSAPLVTPIDLDIWSLDETLVLREWQNIDILALDEAHRMAVLIENKIGTQEHSQQLQRYYKTVQAHYPDWQIVALYLTPEGDLPSDARYLPVDYTLICEVLEQLVSSRASTLGTDVLAAINHYTRMLRRHIVGESELTELCRRIYLKHQRALDLIYEYRPDRQAELLELLKRLINDAHETLVSDYSSKSYVRFAPAQWDKSIPLRSGKGWTRSGRLLLFEFHYRGNDLRLKLTIGPGPRETRQQLLTLALAHKPPFTVTDATLYEKWNMIYDRPMVKDALSLDRSLDEVEAQLRRRWAEFLEHDLQAIEEELQAQQELWQEEDIKL